jgi:hypothetical protein
MADKGLTTLLDLNAKEVSLVDAGANLKKRFPVFKKKESVMNEEILKAVLQTEVDEEARLEGWFSKAKLSDKGKDALKGALRLLSGYKDELPADTMDKLAELAGYPAPKEEKTKKGCGESDEEDLPPKEEKTKMKKALDDPEFAAVFKAQQDELAALKSVNENVTKALKVEKDKRELNEWTQKAREELSHFPGKSSEELGVMLKALSDQNLESAKAQFDLLKAASEAMKTSSILKEAGQFNGGDSKPTSAWVGIEAIAKDLVLKSADRSFTREKAIELTLQRDPELYNRYLSENPAQSGGRN